MIKESPIWKIAAAVASVIGISITLIGIFLSLFEERQDFRNKIDELEKRTIQLELYVTEHKKEFHKQELETAKIRERYIKEIEDQKKNIEKLELKIDKLEHRK